MTRARSNKEYQSLHPAEIMREILELVIGHIQLQKTGNMSEEHGQFLKRAVGDIEQLQGAELIDRVWQHCKSPVPWRTALRRTMRRIKCVTGKMKLLEPPQAGNLFGHVSNLVIIHAKLLQ